MTQEEHHARLDEMSRKLTHILQRRLRQLYNERHGGASPPQRKPISATTLPSISRSRKARGAAGVSAAAAAPRSLSRGDDCALAPPMWPCSSSTQISAGGGRPSPATAPLSCRGGAWCGGTASSAMASRPPALQLHSDVLQVAEGERLVLPTLGPAVAEDDASVAAQQNAELDREVKERRARLLELVAAVRAAAKTEVRRQGRRPSAGPPPLTADELQAALASAEAAVAAAAEEADDGPANASLDPDGASRDVARSERPSVAAALASSRVLQIPEAALNGVAVVGAPSSKEGKSGARQHRQRQRRRGRKQRGAPSMEGAPHRTDDAAAQGEALLSAGPAAAAGAAAATTAMVSPRSPRAVSFAPGTPVSPGLASLDSGAAAATDERRLSPASRHRTPRHSLSLNSSLSSDSACPSASGSASASLAGHRHSTASSNGAGVKRRKRSSAGRAQPSHYTTEEREADEAELAALRAALEDAVAQLQRTRRQLPPQRARHEEKHHLQLEADSGAIDSDSDRGLEIQLPHEASASTEAASLIAQSAMLLAETRKLEGAMQRELLQRRGMQQEQRQAMAARRRELETQLGECSMKKQRLLAARHELVDHYWRWRHRREVGDITAPPTFAEELERGPGARDVAVQNEIQVDFLPRQVLKMVQMMKREEVLRQQVRQIQALVLEIEAVNAAVRAELTCPICRGIFKEPVLMWPCGHSYCHACFDTLAVGPSVHRCHLCGSISSEGAVPNASVASIVARWAFQSSGFSDLTNSVERVVDSLDRFKRSEVEKRLGALSASIALSMSLQNY